MKPKLFVIALGAAAFYLLGTESGRANLEKAKKVIRDYWENPRVAKARRDVEVYARQQAPIIRERAEAAAKAAPGVVADAAKDVASKTAETAKDVASKTAETAKDVAAKTSAAAKDVAAKTSATAKDVAGKVSDTAADVRGQAAKVAGDLRERGEAAVENAVATAGEARDKILDVIDDEDDVDSK